MTYQWNLNTQYEVVNNRVAEIGYVGSRGIHQKNGGSEPVNAAGLNNAAITGAAPTTNNTNLRTPLLGFSPQTAAFANNQDTNYNSLQLTARKNFSRTG